jgi:hypothetical protein
VEGKEHLSALDFLNKSRAEQKGSGDMTRRRGDEPQDALTIARFQVEVGDLGNDQEESWRRARTILEGASRFQCQWTSHRLFAYFDAVGAAHTAAREVEKKVGGHTELHEGTFYCLKSEGASEVFSLKKSEREPLFSQLW